MQIEEITTIVMVILIMSSGTSMLSSPVFAQTGSETDFGNMTLTDSSENLVDTSGLESPQQQPQGPPLTASPQSP